MSKVLVLLLVIMPWTVKSQEHDQISNRTILKSYLIVNSTKNYSNALKLAQSASNSLVIPFSLDGNVEHETFGLTSYQVSDSGQQLGYAPRGSGLKEDKVYVSIEHTQFIQEFSEKEYIIVVATGRHEELLPYLDEVQKTYKDAYVKDLFLYSRAKN